MSMIGTWFLIVHVTSLDRKCLKVYQPLGAFGKKTDFLGVSGGLLTLFYINEPFFFSVEMSNLLTNLVSNKKWLSHFKIRLFDLKKVSNPITNLLCHV